MDDLPRSGHGAWVVQTGRGRQVLERARDVGVPRCGRPLHPRESEMVRQGTQYKERHPGPKQCWRF